MLVRYRRFRHILIFERRDWPDRLVFALASACRWRLASSPGCCCNYNAADLTLEGVVPRRADRRPVRGRHGRRHGRLARRSSTASSSPCPSPSAAGSPAAASASSAPRKPSGTSPRSSSRACTGARGRCCAPCRSTGRSSCCSRRSGSSCCARSLGVRWGAHHRLFYLATAILRFRGRCSPCCWRQSSAWPRQSRSGTTRGSSTGCRNRKAAARGQDRSARQPDQPALPVQHADVDLVPDSDAARDGADADHQALGAAPPAAAKHRSFRDAFARSSSRSTNTWTSRSSASVRS